MPQEHPADSYLTQQELKLQEFDIKPLHLLYLTSIYTNDFDERVHLGHFASHGMFAARVRELMNMGLITYDGVHSMTPRGAAHMRHLLAQKVKP